jgi:short-subunit dehydrogenase
MYMKARGKVIVVTGGGNGIGRQVVLQLLEKGALVCAVDISQKGLEETVRLALDHKQHLTTYIVDVASREAIERLAQEVETKHGHVDGYINVAGIIQPFIHVNELTYEKIAQVMNVNFYGTLYMAKTFIPYLLKREEAHIVHIGSMGGFLPVPGQTVYGASKSAVHLLTTGLHSELRDTNVRVTLVMPGGVATDISKNSGATGLKVDASSSKMKLLTPDQCASIIIAAMEKNKYRVLAGTDSRIMDKLARIAPKKAASIIADKLKSVM